MLWFNFINLMFFENGIDLGVVYVQVFVDSKLIFKSVMFEKCLKSFVGYNWVKVCLIFKRENIDNLMQTRID